MPPALVPSDDEEEVNPGIEVDDVEDDVSDDLDTIPAKKPKAVKPAKPVKAAKAPTPEPEEDEDEEPEAGDVEMDDNDEKDQEVGDEDDDEEEEDEYVPEKILDNQPAESGKQLYRVKWVGYTEEKDLTWEPEENLHGAPDILKAYWKTIGGKPKDLPAKKGRKRKADTSASASPAPAKKGRPSKAIKDESKAESNGTGKLPPPSEWEAQCTSIITIEEGDSKPRQLMVYLTFMDGVKHRFRMETVRQNCPQKLLDYYEEHLTFKDQQELEVKPELKHELKQE